MRNYPTPKQDLDKEWADTHNYCIWKGLIAAVVAIIFYVVLYNLVCK